MNFPPFTAASIAPAPSRSPNCNDSGFNDKTEYAAVKIPFSVFSFQKVVLFTAESSRCTSRTGFVIEPD